MKTLIVFGGRKGVHNEVKLEIVSKIHRHDPVEVHIKTVGSFDATDDFFKQLGVVDGIFFFLPLGQIMEVQEHFTEAQRMAYQIRFGNRIQTIHVNESIQSIDQWNAASFVRWWRQHNTFVHP